jgi:hypothetical protein
MVVFGFYLGGFVEEVCFLFFYMFLGVVKKRVGLGPGLLSMSPHFSRDLLLLNVYSYSI